MGVRVKTPMGKAEGEGSVYLSTSRAWLEKAIRPWIEDRGYYSIKIKLRGGDVSGDVTWTLQVVHTVARPVMLDERLASLGLLPEPEPQGWSGLALKTCNGQSFCLVASAWPDLFNVQDGYHVLPPLAPVGLGTDLPVNHLSISSSAKDASCNCLYE